MNQKVTLQQMVPIMFALLLLVVLGFLAIRPNNPLALPELPVIERNWAATVKSFDYEKAADISAARWQAMGDFYEKQGLLTRDPFD